jgi:hypothetical protein
MDKNHVMKAIETRDRIKQILNLSTRIGVSDW